ncbi:MAG: T9SS type A sorting domain-containing protein [Candidatus Hatepunaea meridiana]|nr:T9SS type A sorting domain-containing protein [Candidatus Hatepunaea meridiana]
MNKHLRNYNLLIVVFVIITIIMSRLDAGLLYSSVYQRDTEDNYVSLPPGSYWGNLHSNDYFYFANPIDTICGIISSAQSRFLFGGEMSQEDLHLRQPPRFNVPPILSYIRANRLRASARPMISSRNGRYMTRVWLRGNQGIIAYQYELGTEPPPLYGNVDDLINPMRIHTPCWGAIFVDGQAEVYGQVFGSLTLGSSGDMWLVDDIYYTGARRADGDFDERGMSHCLGLISEADIIIKNNWYNGRENGFSLYSPQSIDHHSITITAALGALNGSLKFQHTNADWEAYQGPSPDERGIIHLKGMLFQYRAAPLYNENHNGTGYHRINWQYDNRFNNSLPPFFDLLSNGYIGGNIKYLNIRYNVIVLDHTECTGMRVWPGIEIQFQSFYDILVEEKLEINGTEDEPVRFTRSERFLQRLPASVTVDYGISPKVTVYNAIFEEGINVNFNADSIRIDNCNFYGEVTLRGRYIEVKNSTFSEGITLNGWGNFTFDHNLVEGGLIIDGNPRSARITNNTIVNPDGDGVFLDSYRSAELNSNIIAYCERGIVKDNWHDVELLYNNVFGNLDGDYIDCEPGEGSISLNPRFIDANQGDYQLSWNSPCIDAGDPDLPHDPDGSRADIGAFYRDRGLTVPQDDVELPETCSITASPNPFNSSCTISFRVEQMNKFQIVIYDLSGREVFSDRVFASSSDATYTIKGSQLGGAGIYFVRLMTGIRQQTIKLIYLP